MWTDIVEHARQESPRECCGLIAGDNGRAVRLFRLTNLAAGNSLYEIDPLEIYELEFRTLPDQALSVLAIYHSHPVSEAYPSATDRALAFWPDAVYLICSLADRGSPTIRAFQIGDYGIREAFVELVDEVDRLMYGKNFG